MACVEQMQQEEQELVWNTFNSETALQLGQHLTQEAATLTGCDH
ncbi:uncharacterized protein (UPF0303 family) [Paenibacillus sp. JGP012]|nr:hypothetical protein [Paenibacillus sp. JGP012]MBB6019751.1 uncharacterized protein (UPF0303 family) [Paenibacillus sp. JGP012]